MNKCYNYGTMCFERSSVMLEAKHLSFSAKDEDKKIDEIDPNIIPVNDDDRDSSIVS